MRRARPRGAVGLDLSLSSPAGVCLPPAWRPGDWRGLLAWSLTTPKVTEGDERARVDRLVDIGAGVTDFILESHRISGARPAVAIEQYAFSRQSAAVTKLAELGGVVRFLLKQSLDFDPIVTRTLTAHQGRQLLLGKVPREDPKLYVQAALWKAGAPLEQKLVEKWTRWKKRGEVLWNEDVCDAFVIANVLRAELRLPALCLA